MANILDLLKSGFSAAKDLRGRPPIGGQSAGWLENILTNYTPTGTALQRLRRAEALMDPKLTEAARVSKNLEAMGLGMDQFTSVAKGQKDMASSLKDIEDLRAKSTLLGKMNSTTMGQLIGPLAAMGAVTGVGLAGKQVMDVMGAAGINVDPSARVASAYGLQRAIEAKPSLRNVDRALLRRYYEIIFTHNPTITRDPITTANLLERFVNFGGSDNSINKELADTEKSFQEPVKRQADLFHLGSGIVR